MSDARPETIAMLADWRRLRDLSDAPLEQEPDDFLERWLPAAAPHLDAGWNGYGLAPSATIKIRHCMGMTGSPEARDRAVRIAAWIKREAAARRRRGFHPNPLTDLRPTIPLPGIPFPPEHAPHQYRVPLNGTPADPAAGAPRPPSTGDRP